MHKISCNATKAVVAKISIGNIEIEGLMMPDGNFAVAITQISQIFDDFLDDQNQALKKLKRLVGKDLKTTKTKTPFNKNKTNVVSLAQFEQIVAKLDRVGSIKAQKFRDDLVGLSLKQLFSDSFGQKFDNEDRQEWLIKRQQSKLTRRTLTDAIQDYIEKNPVSDNYRKFIYSNCSDAVNKIVFGRSASKLKTEWGTKEVREAMNHYELALVETVERLAIALIDRKNYEPLAAVKEAGNRLLIKKVER